MTLMFIPEVRIFFKLLQNLINTVQYCNLIFTAKLDIFRLYIHGATIPVIIIPKSMASFAYGGTFLCMYFAKLYLNQRKVSSQMKTPFEEEPLMIYKCLSVLYFSISLLWEEQQNVILKPSSSNDVFVFSLSKVHFFISGESKDSQPAIVKTDWLV